MDRLKLDTIAAQLESLEETIIIRVIDRIQFCRNRQAYAPEVSGFGDRAEDLLSIRLQMTEELDAQFGRYESPEERPFCQDLPDKKRYTVPHAYSFPIVNYNLVNVNSDLMDQYQSFLDDVCYPGEDQHYGSTVDLDVALLRALSARIHYGSFFVAESKYQGNPDQYQNLINAGDKEGLMALLTRKEIEEKILARISHKVDYLQREANLQLRKYLSASKMVDFYSDIIIPLTKKGEILYLLSRESND